MCEGDGVSPPFLAPYAAPGPDAAEGTSSEMVIPAVGRLFEMTHVRYFGGPLHDLVLNRVLERFGSDDGKDPAVIKTIMYFEQVLMDAGIIGKHYALLLARKK